MVNYKIERKQMGKIKMKKTKAQMKIQQMAFMLMAIVLFFILAGLFWLAVYSTNLRKEATMLEQEKAVILASMLGESAEFSCGGESYCIDTDKMMVLKDRQAYKNFWFSRH